MEFWHACFMEILKISGLFYGKICVENKHQRPWGKKQQRKKKDTKITVMVALPPDDSLSKEEIVL